MKYKEIPHEFKLGETWYNEGSQYIVLAVNGTTVKFNRLSDGYLLEAQNAKLYGIEQGDEKKIEVRWSQSKPTTLLY